MFLENRNLGLFFILFSAILFNSNHGYAKDITRNATVKVNKPEIIFKYWIINTDFDKDKIKCKVYKPPDMILRKNPEFGKVKFKKGVVIENNKLRDDDKKNCKDKIVKSTAVEFTGDRKGKTSFKVEVLYREGRYEEHIFGNILFNVNVK